MAGAAELAAGFGEEANGFPHAIKSACLSCDSWVASSVAFLDIFDSIKSHSSDFISLGGPLPTLSRCTKRKNHLSSPEYPTRQRDSEEVPRWNRCASNAWII